MGITLFDVFISAILALFVTFFILYIKKFMEMASLPEGVLIRGTSMDFNKLIKKCYSLFPVENISFNGKTFIRGMYIRVVTTNHKTIEGELIGANKENILCILTKKHIIAQGATGIKEITQIVGNKFS